MTSENAPQEKAPHFKPRVTAATMPAVAALVEGEDARQLVDRLSAAAAGALADYVRGVGPDVGFSCDQATTAVKDALIGVLTGKVPGIAPVLGSTSSFGALRAPKATERVTVSTALPASGRLMFFDGETGFVPLSRLTSGKLYMSSEAAVTGVFSWLASQGHSPKDYALRVCLVNFSKDGLAELSEVA